jgi:hypothetical protein
VLKEYCDGEQYSLSTNLRLVDLSTSMKIWVMVTSLEQLMTIYNIGRDTMSNQQQYVCGRDENPETCFLCEQEGKDYCMICADRLTSEECKTLEREIILPNNYYPKVFIGGNIRNRIR